MSVFDKVPARLETIFLHKVTEDLDKTEGRGGSRVVGYFVNAPDAKKAAEGKGCMGYPGRIDTENHAVVIYNDPTTGLETYRLLGEVIQVFYESPEETRARALEKLRGAGMSVAELKSLGL